MALSADSLRPLTEGEIRQALIWNPQFAATGDPQQDRPAYESLRQRHVPTVLDQLGGLLARDFDPGRPASLPPASRSSRRVKVPSGAGAPATWLPDPVALTPLRGGTSPLRASPIRSIATPDVGAERPPAAPAVSSPDRAGARRLIPPTLTYDEETQGPPRGLPHRVEESCPAAATPLSALETRGPVPPPAPPSPPIAPSVVRHGQQMQLLAELAGANRRGSMSADADSLADAARTTALASTHNARKMAGTDLVGMWIEGAPEPRRWTNDDLMSEALMRTPYMTALRAEIQQAIRDHPTAVTLHGRIDNRPGSNSWTQARYILDDVGGTIGGDPMGPIGSYDGSWVVTDINRAAGTARVHYVIQNTMGIKSATYGLGPSDKAQPREPFSDLYMSWDITDDDFRF